MKVQPAYKKYIPLLDDIAMRIERGEISTMEEMESAIDNAAYQAFGKTGTGG